MEMTIDESDMAVLKELESVRHGVKVFIIPEGEALRAALKAVVGSECVNDVIAVLNRIDKAYWIKTINERMLINEVKD